MSNKITPLTTDQKVNLCLQRGEVREGLGWMFMKRLERLVDELLAKLDCPREFYITYFVKWDEVERKIKEFWGVDDKPPSNPQLGMIIVKVDKSGKADIQAMPLDIPMPESEYSDELVLDNAALADIIPLNAATFVPL